VTPVAGTPVVKIEGLGITMLRGGARNAVVHDVDLDIAAGETVGLVGESGSGKSVTALSVLRLLPRQVARYAAGARISVLGRDVLGASEETLRAMRGSDVSIIFQEPMTALNPVIRIEKQMREVMQRHRGASPVEARALSLSCWRT
jgi:ABC-type microcin C transport system duplicated ATPase subunit YejF